MTASIMLVFSFTSRIWVCGAFRKTFTTATFSLVVMMMKMMTVARTTAVMTVMVLLDNLA